MALVPGAMAALGGARAGRARSRMSQAAVAAVTSMVVYGAEVKLRSSLAAFVGSAFDYVALAGPPLPDQPPAPLQVAPYGGADGAPEEAVTPARAALGPHAVYAGNVLKEPSKAVAAAQAADYLGLVQDQGYVVKSRYIGQFNGKYYGGPGHLADCARRRVGGAGQGPLTTQSVDGDLTTYTNNAWDRFCKHRQRVYEGTTPDYAFAFVIGWFAERAAALAAERHLIDADIGGVPATNKEPYHPGRAPDHDGDHTFVYMLLHLADGAAAKQG